jgi:hypothetical protein
MIDVARLAAALIALAAPAPAFATPGVGCDGFLWPLATELAWMQSSAPDAVPSGAKVARPPADKAIELALQPASAVTLAVAPTSTPKPEDAATFAGVVNFDGLPEAGQYQVTLSAHGWIDVVQDGKPLEAIAHTGTEGCDAIRKSVRFEVGPGPFSIQVSGLRKDKVRIAVRPAAD